MGINKWQSGCRSTYGRTGTSQRHNNCNHSFYESVGCSAGTIAGNVYAKKAFIVATLSVSSQDPSTGVHSLVRASKVPALALAETNANAKVKTAV